MNAPSVLLVAPILIPLVFGLMSIPAAPKRRLVRVLGVGGTAASMMSALLLLRKVWYGEIICAQIGSWPAPYGISLVGDVLAGIMVTLSGLIGFSVMCYAVADIDEARRRHHFFALFHFLLLGINGAFLTGDLFNLYVWFEVMLISSFCLLTLGGERAQLEGGVKYVALNLLASTVFLAGVGLLYAKTGTLNLADLSQKLSGGPVSPDVMASAMLLLIAFGIKAGVFPLFFWLPASYHTPPPAVSAVFAGLLTKVGVYAMIRTFSLIFVYEGTTIQPLLVWCGGLTMVTGVLGAAAQNRVRRILSFHIISQIGYMVLGLGLFSPLAVAGAVFYILHHIIVKSNLFLMGGVIETLLGSDRLKSVGGLLKSRPAVALAFLIPAFSLAGIPPLSGFFAKLAIIRASLELERPVVAAVALAVGVLTLFSMTKIWNEVFWKSAPDGAGVRPVNIAYRLVPVFLLCAITLGIGLFGDPLFELAKRAARQLIDTSGYVEAVLSAAAARRSGM